MPYLELFSLFILSIVDLERFLLLFLPKDDRSRKQKAVYMTKKKTFFFYFVFCLPLLLLVRGPLTGIISDKHYVGSPIKPETTIVSNQFLISSF